MENLLSRCAAAVAAVAALGGVAAVPHAHAEAPVLSSAPTEQWQRDALAALLILTMPSSLASSFLAPQCSLLDTRGC
ncbi:hypothetical protein [Corynebacterium auris]|uniref:hypothetical protein n=1 Tax=Corynebacterium auris TaxID=44750 RepID=UPI0025B30544|nr:hypothetical protein [Corynebacterium auris]WJY67257.1 hypothetical protein CAURIS_01630 [Corynebacterium auris]